ncbi:MAG: hypothetical protein LIO77_01405 [Rikenellaceae bacterium]|nr:hypothetical protein [Rikenellaceae bacterium]
MKKLTIALLCTMALLAARTQTRAQESIMDRDLTGTTFTDPEKELGLKQGMGIYEGGYFIEYYYLSGGKAQTAGNTKLLLLKRSNEGVNTVIDDVKLNQGPGVEYSYGPLADAKKPNQTWEVFYAYRMNGSEKEIVEMYYVEYGDKKFTVKVPEPGSNYGDVQP